MNIDAALSNKFMNRVISNGRPVELGVQPLTHESLPEILDNSFTGLSLGALPLKLTSYAEDVVNSDDPQTEYADLDYDYYTFEYNAYRREFSDRSSMPELEVAYSDIKQFMEDNINEAVTSSDFLLESLVDTVISTVEGDFEGFIGDIVNATRNISVRVFRQPVFENPVIDSEDRPEPFVTVPPRRVPEYSELSIDGSPVSVAFDISEVLSVICSEFASADYQDLTALSKIKFADHVCLDEISRGLIARSELGRPPATIDEHKVSFCGYLLSLLRTEFYSSTTLRIPYSLGVSAHSDLTLSEMRAMGSVYSPLYDVGHRDALTLAHGGEESTSFELERCSPDGETYSLKGYISNRFMTPLGSVIIPGPVTWNFDELLARLNACDSGLLSIAPLSAVHDWPNMFNRTEEDYSLIGSVSNKLVGTHLLGYPGVPAQINAGWTLGIARDLVDPDEDADSDFLESIRDQLIDRELIKVKHLPQVINYRTKRYRKTAAVSAGFSIPSLLSRR